MKLSLYHFFVTTLVPAQLYPQFNSYSFRLFVLHIIHFSFALGANKQLFNEPNPCSVPDQAVEVPHMTGKKIITISCHLLRTSEWSTPIFLPQSSLAMGQCPLDMIIELMVSPLGCILCMDMHASTQIGICIWGRMHMFAHL